MKKIKLIERIKYFVERQFVKGAFYQLIAVIVFIGLISVMGGFLVSLTGEFKGDFGDAIWWAFLRLSDPGYLGDDIGILKRIISTILTVLGYVIFLGALVAIMTRWLIHIMNNLEQGLTPVSFKNHIVILGWTNRTVSILRDLITSRGRMRRFLKAHDTNRLRIVVLSENVSPQHMHLLQNDKIIGSEANDIILRSGLALQTSSINRTSCQTAAAIIIPSHYNKEKRLVNSDTEAIKTLFSINNLSIENKNPLPYVVVEIEDARKLPVIQHAYKGPIEVVSSDRIIGRLIAQTVLEPGLSEVYNELLTFGEGNEFYLSVAEKYERKTLSEVASLYPKAILTGVLRKEQQGLKAILNPSKNEVVKSTDKLIWIARNHKDIETEEPVKNIQFEERENQKHSLFKSNFTINKKILILGWNSRIPALIYEMFTYEQINFDIDSFSTVQTLERKKAIEDYHDQNKLMNCRYIENDFMIETELKKLDLKQYDSIIVVSSDHLSTLEEGDARAIVGFLMLDDLLEHEKVRPQIILELNDHENIHLIDTNHCETIISPVIISHFLSQIALRRELSVVYDELFSSHGPEIKFLAPHLYGVDRTISYYQLERHVLNEGDTLLGIYRHTASTKGEHLFLNPPKDMIVDLHERDLIIVLTDDKTI